MAKAKKLPSGNWRVQVQVKKKMKSFTAKTKKQAELMALEYQNEILKDDDDRTVGQCIDEYINSKRNILAVTTINTYEEIHRNALSSLDNVRLTDIDQMTVQKLMNELSLKKSAKTVKNAHGLLAAVLSVFKPEMRLRTTLPQLQKKIKQLPSAEQIISTFKGSEIEIPVLLGLWNGMRLSEIRGAKKSDIHDGVLLLHETIVTVNRKSITRESTKTYDSKRLISLSPYLLELVDKLDTSDDHLTTFSGTAIYKRFSRTLKSNNIPHMSFHDLRHLNASTMLALGVPDKYAMERNGWSSDHIMKSVYQHTLSEERRKVDKMINDYFQSLIDKK